MYRTTNRDGKIVTLYNPYEKRQYYGNQLKTGKDKDGKPLTKRQKAFRSGFIKLWKDSRDASAAKYGFKTRKK